MSLSEAFRNQAISCARLGSPFMGRLCNILGEHWPAGSRLDARCHAFGGDVGPSGASLPLRIAGGLHALVLERRDEGLAALYPPAEVTEEALAAGVLRALSDHEDFLLNWIESPPQTNEVRRAAALMAGAAVVATHFPQPLWLSELGASGGLNLYWDHFALALPAGARLGPPDAVLHLSPDWDSPLPPMTLPSVAARRGVDLNPLDPSHPPDLLRLMAFLWPDQSPRLSMTRAAASVAQPALDKGDAIRWLQKRLAAAPEGHVHLIQHTVACQYFSPEAQEDGRAMIEAAGKAATTSRPLGWLAMESDGDTRGVRGAALTLRLWPGDLTLDLGRVDFHGRWIQWRQEAA